jgi:hypothetical protein
MRVARGFDPRLGVELACGGDVAASEPMSLGNDVPNNVLSPFISTTNTRDQFDLKPGEPFTQTATRKDSGRLALGVWAAEGQGRKKW